MSRETAESGSLPWGIGPSRFRLVPRQAGMLAACGSNNMRRLCLAIDFAAVQNGDSPCRCLM